MKITRIDAWIISDNCYLEKEVFKDENGKYGIFLGPKFFTIDEIKNAGYKVQFNLRY